MRPVKCFQDSGLAQDSFDVGDGMLVALCLDLSFDFQAAIEKECSKRVVGGRLQFEAHGSVIEEPTQNILEKTCIVVRSEEAVSASFENVGTSE